MKIQLLSDLHLEFDNAPTLKLKGGQYLCLAGDVAVAAYLRPNRTDKDAKKHRRVCNAFFREECAKYERVFYILGNHEHYRGIFDNTLDFMREFLEGTNVELLDKQFVDLSDGWQLYGATLWTDFNRDDWFAKHAARDKMSDFHIINKMRDGPVPVNGGARTPFIGKLSPDDIYLEHGQAREALEVGLYDWERIDRKTIVMSHHAPTSLSVHPKYRGDLLNYAYHSDLSEVILDHPNIKYWFHGHTHDHFDYEVGNCRVVCNPRGYAGYELSEGFLVDFEIEV